MEEEGNGQDSDSMNARDSLREEWRKLVESEERFNFFKKMVGWDLEVREIEHLGDDLNKKFRSDRMRGGRSERVVIKTILDLKLKDERRFKRELKRRRDMARDKLEEVINNKK